MNDKRNWVFRASVVWLTIVAVFTLSGWLFGESTPFLTDPNARDAELIKAGPSWDHWFGNATFGQDVFSRVVEGAQISLLVAVVVTFFGIFIGGGLGLLAGYLKG